MSKKLIWIVVVIFTALIAVWIWTFSSIGNIPIVIGGSTSANSFMQGVTTKIHSTDYTYNSTGSQNGINGVFSKIYKAGVLSKFPAPDPSKKWNVFQDENGEPSKLSQTNLKEFEDDKKKDGKGFSATQIAVDSIVIIYNPPGSSHNKDSEINFTVDRKNPEDNLIKKIYEGKINKWSDVVSGWEGNISAFTRETGSGTKTEFENLTDIRDSSKNNVANSNGMMYSSIESTEGSIGFVSLPFVRQIGMNSPVSVGGFNGYRLGYMKDGEPSADKLFKYENNSWTETDETNEDAVGADYKLSRPFVLVFANENVKSLFDIFNFLLSEASHDLYSKEGLVATIKDINPNEPNDLAETALRSGDLYA